ncbi:MAG: flagellar biosynthesis protein [Gammaproteobacteria bacterium]|nr:flagellar biosynthesis protein [Gammaproteobacteria bacterium]MDH5592815.1 flagellar biosynthesis protein [Gammaproteobacteria bacterium]MDH5614850.1 flagellar biosynthesis protein [Gammaproteobacteria bacterium]
MKVTINKAITVIFIVLFLGGCATSRGIVSLQVPESNMQVQSNGKSIFIRTVSDTRIFQENPKSPDTPSLGFGGANNASKELKKRAIARKRNGFGKALGDILLEENQTVESVIKDSLEKSLYEAGYMIIRNKEKIKHTTIIIDASIDKFWSWMKPGFWAITLSSEIDVKLTITNPKEKRKQIYVKSEGHYQMASGGNWLEVMNKSVEQFSNKTKEYLSEI